MDVFEGQMASPVLQKIASNNIQLVKVTSNLTHIYQPLDFTVNSAAKQFMKRMFVGWYARKIVPKTNKDTDVEKIDVPMRLSVMDPLHASCFIGLYNYIASVAGCEVCMKGGENNGIYNVIVKGINALPSLDPFKDIYLLVEN